MKTNPCNNCLLYPICRNQLLSYFQKDRHVKTAFTLYKAYIIKVEPKCNLISNWLAINGYVKYDIIAKCLVLIFNIKDYKGAYEKHTM